MQINETIFYYVLIILNLTFFLVSINFHPLRFYKQSKKYWGYLSLSEKSYTNKNEIIKEYIPQEQIKNLIQEDLPFKKAENKNENKIKFKLPSLELLTIPDKKKKLIKIKRNSRS